MKNINLKLEPAHLDGGMHDRCQQRHRDHTDPQQQKAVQ